MKEEVPPPLIDTHLKSVEEAIKDGISIDANFGLDKTGIAGTGVEEDKEQDKGLPQTILESENMCCLVARLYLRYVNCYFMY